MKTQDKDYQERLRRRTSVAGVVVRIVYGSVILVLAGIAIMMHLRTEAYNRSETAYYHLANVLVSGGEPEYDRVDGMGGHIDSPENMGLKESKWWTTSAYINDDRWIVAETELCQPLLKRLGMEITASFPAAGMT